MQLRSKDKNLEKYIYLSHLKAGDASTFYKLCLEHMSEITPIIYTPTVGDACLHFSHIYRRPEGLVCVFDVCFFMEKELTVVCSIFHTKTKVEFVAVCDSLFLPCGRLTGLTLFVQY